MDQIDRLTPTMAMKKSQLIFFPAPAPGHLVSAVMFAQRLLTQNSRLSITVLVTGSPFNRRPTSTNQTNTSLSQHDRLSYIHLPLVDVPPLELFTESMENAYTAYIASHNPHVRDAIARLQNSPVHVAGLVIDMFCTSAIDVANELGVPSYVFFCSSAAFLGLILHQQEHCDKSGVTHFNESDPDAIIPCFQNPVPSAVLPDFSFNKTGCTVFVNHARRFRETKGIIINTYAELEPHALKSLSVDYELRAPVYTVGPVLDHSCQVQRPCDAAERERIMTWLDKQPEASVVFLCFGSRGYFSEDQTREVAKGLIQSGERFLWSLQKPPMGDELNPTGYTETELKGILTKDFWELVEGERGLICGWAPQVEILGHKGTGAFVSHCGWNSTLESLCYGKPIVTWPLYAEQQINAFELVKELGLAVELTMDYRVGSSNFVGADKVERAVRLAMEKDNPVRCKVKEMAEQSRGALAGGGSSFASLERLMKDMVVEADFHNCE